MKSNVRDGLAAIVVSTLVIFNCIYLGFCVNLKGEEAEITKIEQSSHTVQCYVPKYLGWVIIPDNNYKEGDQITIPMNVAFLGIKNVSVLMGVVYYSLMVLFIIIFLAGLITIFEE